MTDWGAVKGSIARVIIRMESNHQAGTRGWAAKRVEVSKMSKYGAPASQGGQVFLAFVFETYGLERLFASTMKQAEEYRGIPGAAGQGPSGFVSSSKNE